MSAMRWLRALLGATKEERPPLTLEDVQSLVAEMTKASERARHELEQQAAREEDELVASLEAKVEALENQVAQQVIDRIPMPPEPAPETPKLMCACGATAMRVDQVQQALRYVDGRLQLVPDGATLTCPRCGRGFAVDPRGQFDPHRAAWPSSWVVADELDRRKADLDAKLASRGAKGTPLRRTSPVSDMRRPPV